MAEYTATDVATTKMEEETKQSFDSEDKMRSEEVFTKGKKEQKKFIRIRTHVQKLNEEFLATIYELEQRHKKEIERYKATIASEEKNHSEALNKVQQDLKDGQVKEIESYKATFAAQEKESQEAFEKAQEELKAEQKKQIAELYEQLQALEKGHKETYSNAEQRHKSEIRTMRNKMADQEASFKAFLAKAEQNQKTAIKELHGKMNAQARKHEDFRKRAGEKVKKLTQKLLEKHDDLEAYREKALKEVDMMADALARSKSQAACLEASLEKVQKQYLDEYEKRKADEKKIVSLRKMIEQYDGGDLDESAWTSDLTESKSDDSILKELRETPSSHYRKNAAKNKEEFEKLRDSIHALVPDDIKSKYRQVGFHESEGFFFPVLGLSPFDIPPGPRRDQWLDNADKFLGVFYYGQEEETLAYDMILVDGFIPYMEGVKRELHIIPASLIEKQQAGQEITTIEKLFIEGIKKVNMQARSAPEDREHLLQHFEEDFNTGDPTTQVQVELEKIRNSLKDKLSFGDSATERANLMAEMDDIMNDDESEEGEVEVDNTMEEFWGTHNKGSTLDDQVTSFIAELSSSAEHKKKVFETESRDEAREWHTTSVQGEEARDSTIAEKPSYEKMQESSIVQRRLAMFSSEKHADKAPKLTVETGGNTKSVMNMWKQKAAETTTPKQANVTPRKNFAFCETPKTNEEKSLGTPRTLKRTSSSSSVNTAGSSASSRTRRVTIPKKIVMKIEAGEELSLDEREILEGIQKFNSIKTPTAASVSTATAE